MVPVLIPLTVPMDVPPTPAAGDIVPWFLLGIGIFVVFFTMVFILRRLRKR